MRLFQLVILFLLVTLPFAAVLAAETDAPPAVTGEAINAADLGAVPAEYLPPAAGETTESGAATSPAAPDPAIVKLQVLLDRAGASPGVIDGFDGDNVRKAVSAFETMAGLPVDGKIDADVVARLQTPDPVVGSYTITPDDVSAIVPAIPTDYAEMAKLKFLGYTSVPEELAERFHMDEKLLKTINPAAQWVAGEAVAVTAYGPDKTGQVVRIEADKSDRQLRGYDADGRLLVAYPATIGSTDNPSPTGTHLVDAIAPMPNYTYNPDVNFQQGSNTQKLIIPPGPNGPVGAMWIDLTEPTFGIHGTPEPSQIDKTNSHGCVRLTNWDATELSTMVAKGVPVEFID
jgi:lipoprotein-anchoring transpeptidase ErfK/SrfK